MTTRMISTEWVVTDSDDNAASTASRAGVAGSYHYITGVTAGFTAATVGKKLAIKDASTTLVEIPVNTTIAITFPNPIRITAGNAAVATLEASGAGGTVGHVSVMGYTI